jgi:hypothetical protein
VGVDCEGVNLSARGIEPSPTCGPVKQPPVQRLARDELETGTGHC